LPSSQTTIGYRKNEGKARVPRPKDLDRRPFLLVAFHQDQGVSRTVDYESKARVTEIIAGSPRSFDHAIQVGFKRVSRTLRGIAGIEISDFRCKVENDAIVEYRVTLHVTFVLDT